MSTLINLTRSKSQVQVDEQANLSYEPTIFPATIPTSPSNGNYLRNFVIGALVGLLLGVLVAYALALARRQFEHAHEPEVLYRVPLISLVPAFQHPHWMPTGLPVLTDPTEEPAEAIRVIATALRSMRGTDDSLLVSFSAAVGRSGTTTMVANVGLALAEMGERVLVIDGDPVGRGLTRTLTDTNLDQPLPRPRQGFSEVVGGCPLLETIIPADANPRLLVLTSGRDPNMAIHRWSPQALRLALDDAAAQFDFVLIDVPPVGSSSYGIDLSGAAGKLILVIPYLDLIANHERLPERLNLAGCSLVGYIFNGALSTGRFVPYYPVLYSAAPQPARAIAMEPATLVVAAAYASEGAPPSPGAHAAPGQDVTGVIDAVSTDENTSTGVHRLSGTSQSPEDITGVVDSVPTEGPITGQTPAAGGSDATDGSHTRPIPVVHPDDPNQ